MAATTGDIGISRTPARQQR